MKKLVVSFVALSLGAQAWANNGEYTAPDAIENLELPASLGLQLTEAKAGLEFLSLESDGDQLAKRTKKKKRKKKKKKRKNRASEPQSTSVPEPQPVRVTNETEATGGAEVPDGAYVDETQNVSPVNPEPEPNRVTNETEATGGAEVPDGAYVDEGYFALPTAG